MTGRWEDEKADPMAGMTDEQKEYEAEKLLNVMDKLQRYVPLLLFYCLNIYIKGKLFNLFPHNKILDQTKLKAFADDKCNKNHGFCVW